MDIKSMRKTVSISCSYKELELLEQLKKMEIGNTNVFKKGLIELCKEFNIDME